MWEPTPYDQDPFDSVDGPPLPGWTLHVPGAEPEAPVAEAAEEAPAALQEPVAPAVAPEPGPVLPDQLESLPPRTILRRLSQLVAPIKVESHPAAPLSLPSDVDRMESALAGLERQISQPRPAPEPGGFVLPNLMDRIRTARLKASEPAAPAVTPAAEVPVPDPPPADLVLAAASELAMTAEQPAPALEAQPEAPELEPEAPVLAPDMPVFPQWADAGLADSAAVLADEPGSLPLPETCDELPPVPVYAADPIPEPPAELPAVLAPEVRSPAPPVSEGRAASRHLESLIAALDGEMTSHAASTSGTRAQSERPEASAERFVVFQLGNTRYGLAIGEVLEMATVPRTTPLPNVPDFVRGVANLRGEVLAVIDLRTLLALEAGGDTVRERLLVVRAPHGESVAGLIVDSVRGLARLGREALVQPTMPLETRVADFLEGVTSHEDQVLNILDTRKLFAAPEIAALSAN